MNASVQPRASGAGEARQHGVELEVDRATVRYGSVRVFENLSLRVGAGEFVALLGSSGCGKTTLLRTIAGFIQPQSGAVRVGGRDVTGEPPDRRGMALVFQTYALWPHMTVAQNIGYGLKVRRRNRAEIARRVSEIAALLGLDGLEGRKPAALSGGQRQRVALGRALAVSPDILLLDEPLSNLDARIRLTVRQEISALQHRLGITAVHVTHDREEAMVMADRIVILNAGRIAQIGTPQEVYREPSSAFVAAFMGAENVVQLDGVVAGDRLMLAGPGCRPAAIGARRKLPDGPVVARFRSEAAEFVDAAPGMTTMNELLIEGDVTQVSFPGGFWRHVVETGAGTIVVDRGEASPPGSRVVVRVPGEALYVFPAHDD